MLKIVVCLGVGAAFVLLSLFAWASYDVTGSSVASLFYTGGNAPDECQMGRHHRDSSSGADTESSGDHGEDDDCADENEGDDTRGDEEDGDCEEGGHDAFGDCAPNFDGPAEGPQEADTDPAETVRAFYLHLNEKRFADAYALFTPVLQASEDFSPFEVWVRGYDGTASITPLALAVQEQDQQRALVAVELESVDRDPSGNVVTSRFSGTWSLLRSNGQWLLADTQIARLDGVSTTDDCDNEGTNAAVAGCISPPGEPVQAPDTADSGPAGVVRAFYLSLTERRFNDAYSLLSPALQSSEDFAPFNVWVQGYDGTVSITPAVIVVQEHDESQAVVAVELQSVDRDPSGAIITRSFEGTWSLVRGDGGWLLADTHVVVLDQAPD